MHNRHDMSKRLVGWLMVCSALVLLGSGCSTNLTQQQSYPDQLWNRLSSGDVSSVDCQRAIDRYEANTSAMVYGFESFYSYKKKRCLGFDSENYSKDEAGRIKGHADKIFDLITNDVIVSCGVLYVGPTILCKDAENTWSSTTSSEPLPLPYPIYLSTWLKLKELE